MSGETTALYYVVVEGCVDRFCGRPLSRNPYNQAESPMAFEAWAVGWVEGGALLELRAAAEAARWLGKAA